MRTFILYVIKLLGVEIIFASQDLSRFSKRHVIHMSHINTVTHEHLFPHAHLHVHIHVLFLLSTYHRTIIRFQVCRCKWRKVSACLRKYVKSRFKIRNWHVSLWIVRMCIVITCNKQVRKAWLKLLSTALKSKITYYLY